jgi:NAD(P)H-flavin reductase
MSRLVTRSEDSGNPFYRDNPFEDKETQEKVIREVFRGRELLWWYVAVVIAIFVGVCLHYWAQRFAIWLVWHRAKRAEKNLLLQQSNNDSASSSSTSGPPFGPYCDNDDFVDNEARSIYSEESPFFDGRRTHPVKSRWFRWYCWLQGMLMKQSEQHNTFEDAGTMLVLVVYHIISFAYLFWDMPRFFVSYAFRLGLLCVANVPLMYILGAKHSPVAFLTGWSYEQLNVFHRHVGRLCVLAFIFHTIFFLFYFRVPYLFTHAWSIMGIIAGTCFFAIGITSQRWIKGLVLRDTMYELFYLIHFVGMILALPAIYFHYPTARPFAALAMLSVVYDRVYRVLYDYRAVYCKVEVHPGDTVILRLPKKNHVGESSWWLLRRQKPLTWKAGEHVFITLPGCGIWESHPFTVASSANVSDTLDIIVRAKEGFTRRLYDQEVAAAAAAGGVGNRYRWVIIHGPYGVHLPSMPDYKQLNTLTTSGRTKQKIVLVSGGAGVAFTWPLYQEYLLGHTSSRDELAVVDHLSKTDDGNEDAATTVMTAIDGSSCRGSNSSLSLSDLSAGPLYLRNASHQCRLEIHFLWVIPYRSFISWLPDLAQACGGDSDVGFTGPLDTYERYDNGSVLVHRHIWITREAGRPDIKQLVKDMVGPEEMDEINPAVGKCQSWVATCGPDYMVRMVRNAVAELRLEGRGEVEYYAEKFGW